VQVCCRQRGCGSRLSIEERQTIEEAARMRPRPAPGSDVDGGGGGAPVGDAGSPPTGATCGNDQLEQGETCDPPSSCPTACPQMGCETFELVGRAATCNARCVAGPRQTTCTSGDKCCPPGCATAGDKDCACTCGNGMVEETCGEKCDPLASCPTSCPPRGCMLRRAANPGTCMAECVDDRPQDACANNDGCCPPTCHAGNDNDCTPRCGNRTVERGETCDPPESCPTSCRALGCTRQKLEGSASACTARCVDDGAISACMSGDGCCPPSCTSAMDSDCTCTCGNGMVEPRCGETCDPLTSCPASCPPRGCQLRRLVNRGTCQAQCVDDVLQSACMNGDGCCPSACNASNDNDCMPRCGNGVVETGELCDPPSSCPATCPWMGCGRRKLEGTAATCNARCVEDGTQTMCARGDGCCPPACNSSNDNDCMVRCGNGVVETGEKCDGNCPTSCPAVGCQTRRLTGSAAQCNAECVNDAVITMCASGDMCCASGCTTVNDADCTCRCGNGTTEPACNEKCDGASCPTACPPMGCQRRMLQGTAAACSAECVNAGLQTMCANGDGCCPPSPCNANNDNDCRPVCGNGAVEAGEKCDPVSACQTQFDTCVSDAATIRTRTGSVAACTFECTSTPRTCSATPDSFCVAGCTACGATCAAGQDIDCKQTNGSACTHRNQCAVNCLDGRCCATATCGVCESCTGAAGTCADILVGREDTEPANACAGANSCNGMGVCRKDNGQPCGTDGAQCVSGRCVDGVCCATACTEVCHACNVAGAAGQCRPVANGSTEPACTGEGRSCQAGTCKLADGSPCNAPGDCISNACTTFYPDIDGDMVATATGVKFCGTTAPAWHLTQPGADCCGMDSNVFPGQTGWFTARTNCGGFDFNCSGVEERERSGLEAECTVDRCVSGWRDIIPGCGESAVWRNCSRMQTCVLGTTPTLTQRCR
jgi:hypothetical protein